MYLRVGTGLSAIAVLLAAPLMGAAQEAPRADGSGGLGDWILRVTQGNSVADPSDDTSAPQEATGSIAPNTARPASRPAQNGRVAPVAPAGQRSLADDPMAEPGPEAREAGLGLRGPGNMVWYPSAEARGGWTSNVAGKRGGQGGATYGVSGDLTVKSDWSRHAFEASLRGAYTGYPSDTDQNAPAFDGSAKLRLDLADGWRSDLAVRAAYSRGSASSAENPADTVIPSTSLSRGLSAGITREAGWLGLTLRGDVDRTTYSGGQTSGGVPITSDKARDNTRMALAVRTTFGGEATVRPYVEVQAIHRTYDAQQPIDRGATGGAALVGAALDFGPILKGAASVGWTREQPNADSLPALQGLMFDGNLVWSPTRLARVSATAKSTFEPTTLDGSSGSISREVGLVASLDLTRDTTLETGARISRRVYSGIDRAEQTVGAHGEIGWWLRPDFELFARGEWSRFTANTPGEDYSSVMVLTGVRVRR